MRTAAAWVLLVGLSGCATAQTAEGRASQAGGGTALTVLGGLGVLGAGVGVGIVAAAGSAAPQVDWTPSYAMVGAGGVVGAVLLVTGVSLLSAAYRPAPAEPESIESRAAPYAPPPRGQDPVVDQILELGRTRTATIMRVR